ncbi:MAG TPA: LysE family translocator [Bryobacteraceae bacterium]|jgi:threonine/homoserine/homoserine lactone efflux protein|nr:LysE family translocator [Bryobacteraceae bacterium]
MKVLELLVRGLLAGLIITAPVGPVNVLCVQRTITKDWRSGLFSGLGSALADSLYAAIAGFSISFVIQFLLRELFWIRFFGGVLLILLGVWYYFRPPASLDGDKKGETDTEDSASTFLLTLTNPTTILSFMAVMAALGLAQSRPWYLTLLMVGAIFCGAMLWWVILTGIANRLRDRFTARAMVWMNRIGGLAIGAFGVITLLLSRSHPR